jgi:uncharacterized coiled-coil protein SlyX
MKQHPIPDVPVCEDFGDIDVLRSRITTLEARILAQEETIARSAETIATLTRLLEQERIRA